MSTGAQAGSDPETRPASLPDTELGSTEHPRAPGTRNVLRGSLEQRHGAVALGAPSRILPACPIERPRREVHHRDLLACRAHPETTPERLTAGTPPSHGQSSSGKPTSGTRELHHRSHGPGTLLRSESEYNMLPCWLDDEGSPLLRAATVIR